MKINIAYMDGMFFSVNHLIHFHRSLFVDPMDSHDTGVEAFGALEIPEPCSEAGLTRLNSVNSRENQQLYWYHGE